MKKVVLDYLPEKNIEGGIMVEIGATSRILMDIIEGKQEYELPNRNIFNVYIYTKVEPQEV